MTTLAEIIDIMSAEIQELEEEITKKKMRRALLRKLKLQNDVDIRLEIDKHREALLENEARQNFSKKYSGVGAQ